MLDADTKRRIDTARDILVGKIPDPKSQVEQITLALIYKFMDDMDAQAEELGGQREFFAGDFERYGWARLMRSGLGGQEKLILYSDAIARIPQNPGLPPLFRDIFSNAFLPYRDPETLMLFLEVIDGFSYGDSENLGDAYEYLLSVLGVQGDAGQFRTPRHIIDFIVAVVNPQKTETILDPACGTAGFLISAWQHIRQANADDRGGDTLTPAERHRLAANLLGYDISPDFVRLSRVNMYLHGFAEPHIVEYDTLTSQERWDQYADVIITNPPFMSPRGGIQPHNRFSVQSRRSEVLFVDYIAEHLNPQGRAGVIVPEGVIFQSGNAYKQLRKMLVDNYLAAVISLPGGVFQPYSGVKTSILILDKSLAVRADTVAFFKVERDGFDLGAQRRPIDQDDLPAVQSELQEYLRRLRAGENLADFAPQTGLVVDKAKLAAGEEYNLSGERYRTEQVRTSEYDLVPFAEVCTLEYGASLPQKNRIAGPYPVMGSNGISGYHNEYLIEGPAIVVGRKGSAGEVAYVESNCFPIDTTYYVKLVDPERVDVLYLYHLLKTLDLPSLRGGAGIPGLNRNDVYEKYKLPLPPLSVQEEIVAEVAGYQRVIDGARAVADNWRPRVDIDPSWPVVALGEVVEVLDSMRRPITKHDRKPGPYPYYGATGVLDYVEDYLFDEPLVLVGEDGAKWDAGENTAYPIAGKTWVNNHAHVLRPDRTELLDQFLVTLFVQSDLSRYITGVTVPKLTQARLRTVPIPLPPMRVQEELVAGIEEERRRAVGAGELAGMLEERVRGAVGRVWG